MKQASFERLQKLVILLSDGKFHSGERLANELSVSRTAVWKLISKLESWEIEVFAVRGKGYKIPSGLSLIDGDYVKSQVIQKSELFSDIEVLSTIDSTSKYLSRTWVANNGKGKIVVSEHQSSGKGRNGKPWVSPFGSNLYFSLGLNLPIGLSALGGLSLAIGIGLCRLLNGLSKAPIKLKWPNDLLVNEKKMAGILVEASGDPNDNSFLNVGIGLNWSMKSTIDGIDQPWANLSELLLKPISRNELLAKVLTEVEAILTEYIENGFSRFKPHWAEQSAFVGKKIKLITRKEVIEGKEVGIDNNGAIRIAAKGAEKRFYSGEVSLRSNEKSE